MKIKRLCLLFVPLTLLSCSNDDNLSPNLKNDICPVTWTSNETSVIKKNTAFGNKMFRALCLNEENKNENITFSPISMEYLLGIIANGASDGPRKEMFNVMGYDDTSMEEMNNMYEKMNLALSLSDTYVKTTIANAAWVQNDFAINQEYKDSIKKVFNATANQIDFKNTAVAQNILNKWCEDNTYGMIKKTSLSVDPAFKLVLANATYFKGTWKYEFDKNETKKDNFTCNDGSVEQVDMMNQTGSIAYSYNENYQMVVLPYGNGSFSMTLILPKEGLDINQLAANIDWAKTDTTSTNISLYLPKFRMESHWKEFDKTLETLGMKRIFNDENAMSHIANRLFVSTITQDVCIDINESGTEAAAVSMGGIMTTSYPDKKFTELKFNRPFLFAIKERTTGTPLFIGKISKI